MFINYICFLNNAPPNLTELRLEHGFRIKLLPWKDGIDLVDKLKVAEPYSSGTGLSTVEHDLETGDQMGIAVVILNQLDANLEFDSEGQLMGIPDEVIRFQQELEDGYLANQLAKIRLFKEGNISKMASIQYFMEEKVPRLVSISGRVQRFDGPSSSDLSEREVCELQAFIDQVQLPFEYPYLQLAHDIYERSYEIDASKIDFLLLMRGMEALFSRGSAEISYSVSRNAAVLLNVEEDKSEDIFNAVQDLYRKQNTLMHGRHESKKRSKRISDDDVVHLRSLLRRGIIRVHSLGMDKDQLLSLLNRSKF